MKARLAAVAGLVLAAALAAAVPSPRAEAACSNLQLPRPTAAGVQSLYGHIASLRRRNGHYVLRFDPAFLLTGVTASRAALEDTGSPDVPNDAYTVDETHRLLTFLVPSKAQASVLYQGPCVKPTTVARLARSVPRAGFWIQIRSDKAVAIDQQYHP
jgi:hypothetical protein